MVLNKVFNTKLDNNLSKEIIVVDDSSNDKTAIRSREFIETNPGLDIRILEHQKNKGKGAAVRMGIQHATGDYIIIQDADLEYDPAEYNILLQPILENKADVVYGSRFIGGRPHRVLFFWHSVGNGFLTFLSNYVDGSQPYRHGNLLQSFSSKHY